MKSSLLKLLKFLLLNYCLCVYCQSCQTTLVKDTDLLFYNSHNMNFLALGTVSVFLLGLMLLLSLDFLSGPSFLV